ncbi:hypothetical protein BIV25_18260 [Streptomyces sp. MUSC 14]|uniref:hypothetical protein n=1 Tax=Streptomyces sp. MUSC 14 TaxID=1354889 RepID=UPI0008F5E8DF|nr:hypothetical protein [Streptomyces sp. MUSC 14]OIJ96502.1 hypothetical protein BIV25_18260 [Streptomyces sp. MUSC 14]
MAKPDTRRLDRAIEQTARKLKAVQEREMWPLTGPERRTILAALAGGSYKVLRGNNPARADRKLKTAWGSAETRLTAEITALRTERQRIVHEAATAKAAKKSSGWW